MMKKKLGIYIHIPFCSAKCGYCGFYSKSGSSAAEQKDYVKTLIDDIKRYGKTYGSSYLVDTIFIGGGTPSVLPPSCIREILESLRVGFDVDPEAEITIEANPKTVSAAKLQVYRENGVNRLSMGLQSFDRECLRTLGRIHTAEDFVENFHLARQCGFDNINIDLMFAIPGQTMDIWLDTLRKAVVLSPEHLSFYSLQIEEGTPFYQKFMTGQLEEIPDDVDRAMYHRAIAFLKENGYEHYEISNCCRPGYACRHNLKYWSMEEYLGIGSGASSYVNGIRFTESPFFERHENDFADETSEFVFTGLRKTCGISLDQFARRFGREFWTVFGDRKRELEEYFASGMLVEEDGWLRLSETGIDVSNRIMAEFV